MFSRWIRCASTALMAAAFCGAALSAPPKPPTVTLTSPANGASFAEPASITLSANASDSDGTVSKVEFFRGTTLIATVASAPYTYVWSNVAAGSYSITAKATDNGGATATSSAASVTVSTSAASIAITSPAAGSAVNQTVDVSGTFTGAADTTLLVYNGVNSTVLGAVTGTNTFLARNVPLIPGSNTLSATAVRRDGLTASTSVTVTVPHLLAVLTSPAKNGVYDISGSVTFQASVLLATGNVQRVEYYAGANLLGSATAAPYTYVWNNPSAGSYSLYARVVDDAGLSQSSNAINVTVVGPNQLPTVGLTAPANGATYSAPANITLQASAADSDGTISSVEFLQNGALLGGTNIAPYSLALTNVGTGSYAFTARATDNRGGVVTSSPVNVSVTPPNDVPTVNLTSPQASASYIAPASVALAATAADNDGTVSRVEFYAGSALVATATTAPYTATWAVSVAGSYAISAKAFDDLGASTVSGSVTVAVGDGVTYLHNDFAGNPIAATDSSGAVIWKETFRPYGDRLNNQAAASGNRQWFHGKAVDADTGLSYFGARYYDATIGRFMGIDAVAFKEDNLHSFNRYAYGNNNPHRFVDPDGNDPVDSVKNWWNASLAGFQSDSIGGAATKVLQGFGPVEGAMVGAIGALRAAGAEATVLKGVESAESGGLNLFKWRQPTTSASGGWKNGDFMLHLPDQGSYKANWAQNAGRLREQMRKGKPIYDSYRDATTGKQIATEGFLRAERQLLESHGWQYNPSKGAYLPPAP